jgi:uncharacterized protein (TIGR02453 family)
MLSKSTLSFLKDLSANNNREWFTENKARYEAAKSDFEKFIDALIPEIAAFDKSVAHNTAKSSVYRIYRDVRFSKDKSPYKTHLGAYITSAVKKSDVHLSAGYYIHIQDGASILAGGAYTPPTDWLSAIRQEIDYNTKEFKKIINGKEFKNYFGKIEGEKLSRPPKGYEAIHPEIELLKLKSFLVSHNLSNKELHSPDLLANSAKVFKTLYPFNSFLNRAKD